MVSPARSNNMKVATQTDKRKKIYRYCCTIKPTQTCPLWHTAEGGHLHTLIPKTAKQPKFPALRLPVPADEQTVECLHVHRRGRFSVQVCGPSVPCGGKNSLAIFYCPGSESRMGKCRMGSHYTIEPVRLSWAWGQDFHTEQREQGISLYPLRLLWTKSQLIAKILS